LAFLKNIGNEDLMDSYLVRIYRRSKDDPEQVVGVVEEIDSGLNRSFQDMAQLAKMLTLEKFTEKEPAEKKRIKK